MSTQDHHGYLDLDAVVGKLDDDMDGSVAGEADGTGEAAAPTVLAATRRSFQIAPGRQLKVRGGPSTTAPVVGKLAPGSWIQIRCQRRGQRITGPYGTTDIWDSIGPGQFVSDAYVRTGSDGPVAPSCGS
ncbi:SH3 domain-containing protein [Streptomyces chattanoogensis]|uniref:SH3 domain-containing protein n=1 Tax=Streptomyces chattanoogensis TaxID=66876 RepID=UPI0036745575